MDDADPEEVGRTLTCHNTDSESQIRTLPRLVSGGRSGFAQCQPTDSDFSFDLFEFGVAGQQNCVLLFCERGSEAVGIRHSVF